MLLYIARRGGRSDLPVKTYQSSKQLIYWHRTTVSRLLRGVTAVHTNHRGR